MSGHDFRFEFKHYSEGLYPDDYADARLILVLFAGGACELSSPQIAFGDAFDVHTGQLILVPPKLNLQWRVGMHLSLLELFFSAPQMPALDQLQGRFSVPSYRSADGLQGIQIPEKLPLASDFFGDMIEQRVSPRVLVSNDPVLEHFAAIARTQVHEDSHAVVQSLARTLLYYLSGRDAPSTTRVPESISDDDQVMERLQAFVDDRLGYDLGVEDLARHVQLSKFQLLRLMKKQLNQTPQQFVIARRIEKAKVLLKQRDVSLADIAFQTGFSSQSHLSNTFKQITGSTPKTFREG